ncbi:hypothetical protein [Metamycoplasma alkalescens]|uniref:hypothetical protein n=1 Tax=Metamycoplasma alkalescens TaxID=45363 RepID=UPI003D04CB45
MKIFFINFTILLATLTILIGVILNKLKNNNQKKVIKKIVSFELNNKNNDNNKNNAVFLTNKTPKSPLSAIISGVDKQINNFLSPEEFENEQKNNPWVKIYYQVIDKMVAEGAIIKPYNILNIKEHRNRNSKNEIGQWNYCRHHIDEIRISGAIFKEHPATSEHYKTADAILITFDQHLFLHYIIVMAQTTYPNNGMIVPLYSFFKDADKNFLYWDKKVQELCQKYSVPYYSDWNKYLTIRIRLD